ncbi:hypothetical protein [Mucilaginibacter sp.]|uniref:hypothetical protein n=1 Tax=Mucilaginibacter sp. TaxID=1882438 RepID=UPI003D0B84E5
MGNNFETVKRNAVLLLKDDIIKDEGFKEKIRVLDGRVHKMLLWSTLSSVWSYLILIVTIGRIYASFNGKHTLLLFGCMLIMYLGIGVLIYLVWKGMSYNRSYFYFASKTYLKYQIQKISGQRKLISCYLLEYFLLLAVAGGFFYMDIKNGLSSLLTLTAPVSLITYGIGIYFIAVFTMQIRKLNFLHQKINEHYVGQFHQN